MSCMKERAGVKAVVWETSVIVLPGFGHEWSAADTRVMSGISPVSDLFEGGPHGGHAAGAAVQSDKRPSGEAMTTRERAVTGRRDGRGSGG